MAQLIYGKNSVLSLIETKKEIKQLYILQSKGNDEVLSLAKKNNINYKLVDRRYLDNLVKGNHQGYAATIDDYKTYDIDQLIDSIEPSKMPLLVICDGIEDPHNLGAILRSCCCVGADGVIIEKNRCVSLNPTVAKVSVGAIDKIKVASVTNLVNTLKCLKERGYWIIGTDMSSTDYRSVDYNMPVALVVGSEGKGMHRLVKENCDIVVSIPMTGHMNSLNASVAASIVMYQVYNSRFPLKK